MTRAARVVLAMLVMAYAATYSAVCMVKYHWFLYEDIDLAVFAHLTAGLLHGSIANSLVGMSGLGDHSSLNLFLIAPIYALFPSARTLLIVQSVALGLGALPVYRLALRELDDEWVALSCAALYLLQPTLGYINLFEFHPEALSLPALLAALVMIREGRTRAATLWAGVALLGKEDVALVVVMLAAYALALRRAEGRRQALWLAALAAASLALSFGVLKPALGGGLIHYETMYGRWGRSSLEVLMTVARRPLEVLAALFSTPGDPHDTLLKQQYWIHLLLPLAFLPLVAPEILLLAAPVVLEHMLSWRAQQHTLVYQYGALVLPFAMAAAVVGLRRTADLMKAPSAGVAARAPALLVMVVALAAQLAFGPFSTSDVLRAEPPSERLWPTEYDRAMAPEKRRMLARIPARGAVVAGFGLLPNLAGRAELHSLHHVVGGRYIFSDRRYPNPTHVVAMIADWSNELLMAYPNRGTGSRLRELAASNGLVPVEALGDLVLYLRAPEPSTVLTVNGRCDSPTAPPVVFDRQLAFLGAQLGSRSLAAGDTLAFGTCWRVVGPADGQALTEWLVLDSAGDPMVEQMRDLGYMIDPPSDRPVGDVFEERYRLIVPRSLASGPYTLAMRVGVRREGHAEPSVASDSSVVANDGVVPLGSFTLGAPPSRRP